MRRLDGAALAGTARSAECTLILTEGDSAKALAMAGRSVVGSDRYGVFPLKGKLLNVREVPLSKVQANEQITAIAKILGLAYGAAYDRERAARELRYGHVMMMCDQDNDGSHIMGLLINMLHALWPSLLTIDGFLQELYAHHQGVSAQSGGRVARGGASGERVFFTLPEYDAWRRGRHHDGAARAGGRRRPRRGRGGGRGEFADKKTTGSSHAAARCARQRELGGRGAQRRRGRGRERGKRGDANGTMGDEASAWRSPRARPPPRGVAIGSTRTCPARTSTTPRCRDRSRTATSSTRSSCCTRARTCAARSPI